MKKITDIVQICYTTKEHELPAWVRNNVRIGGPGFFIKIEGFKWYDYVVRTERGDVMGMTREDVDTLLANAALITLVINKKQGMTDGA